HGGAPSEKTVECRDKPSRGLLPVPAVPIAGPVRPVRLRARVITWRRRGRGRVVLRSVRAAAVTGGYGGRVEHRPGLDPAVAEVRLAVRRALAGLDSGSAVVVALSGGADSLALAAATAFEAPKLGLRAVA